mgnify:CR=1 FL=1
MPVDLRANAGNDEGRLAEEEMLNLLPTSGEYEIAKRTKYGVYVKIGTSKVFLPWSVITKVDEE